MSSLSINDDTIENYFGYLMHLDNKSKKRLLLKLTESMKEEKKTVPSLEHLFGAREE